MAEVWLVNRATGQMGNRLMFFAAVYAWCLHKGHDLFCPGLGGCAEFFTPLAGQLWPSPTRPVPTDLHPAVIDRTRQARIDRTRLLAKVRLLPGVVRKPSGVVAYALPPTDETFPPPNLRRRRRLWIPAWRCFNPVGIQRYRAQIVAALTPRPDRATDAADFAASLDPTRLHIGVHVRRGDYRNFLAGKHFHPASVYHQQMRAIAERFADRRPQFVIFSDEPRNPGEFPGLDVVISGGDMIADLLRMARMHAVVGPMSSFSAMASYLGNGVAYHFGPHAGEDNLQWVYHGYPVVHSVDELHAALGDPTTITSTHAGTPGYPIELRPRKDHH
ncbi:MAG: hypothetical protein ACK54T_09610 [bacterium]